MQWKPRFWSGFAERLVHQISSLCVGFKGFASQYCKHLVSSLHFLFRHDGAAGSETALRMRGWQPETANSLREGLLALRIPTIAQLTIENHSSASSANTTMIARK